jgi:hypothetical protein
MPHALSTVSQTPLEQTSVPASVVHLPFKVGFVWVPSVGIGIPFASFAVQVFVASSHHLPIVQSPSTLQPPAGSQCEFVLHAPDWQTTLPVAAATHGPSPLARPHSLFVVSHTPLEQTSVAAAAVHLPFKVGVIWVPSIGIGVLFGSFAVQVFVASSHHLPIEQSASTLQPPAGSQSMFVLHAPDWQTVLPVAAATHGPSPSARPHSSFMSHTAAVQTAAPTPVAHFPLSTGVWPVIVGIGVPLASLFAQTPVCVLQN